MSAYYCDTLINHQNSPTNEIVGIISNAYSKNHLDLKRNQIQAWIDTINTFKKSYENSKNEIQDLESWGILYEYRIPRRGKKIDVVLIASNVIFVVEIKNNQDSYNSADIVQLEDYCLDLRDFHLESKERIIIPILLSTDAQEIVNDYSKTSDLVTKTLFANSQNISEVILKAFETFVSNGNHIEVLKWNKSDYSPTPTIIEAAQTLYSEKNVKEISRNHAGVENLTNTSNAIIDAIRNAQQTNSKIICFITGVPGAGKTLAGLNIVHNEKFITNDKELGVFLSGNSPLVKVLSEALARDFSKRNKINKTEAKRKVKTFIHNVHEFIDEYYSDTSKLPIDKVLVYDEAQRAWTKEHKSRKSNGEINESEPEILLSIMDRFQGWGAIIALVGGGQEINTGEAGLREWGKSIESKFKHWKVYISNELKEGDHSTGNLTLFDEIPSDVEIIENESLHLNVSIRSYKAKELSQWVALVLENKNQEASILLKEKLKDYPLFITRNLETAKNWLKKKARGTRRVGVIASSGGRRLKAIGYDPYFGLRGDSSQDELGAWYLNPNSDVRSSNFLEIISTEYAVQGLEIDWAGVFWDADLRRLNNNWDFKQFRGTNWQNIGSEEKKQYTTNKYRVLLTRAREGAIVLIPKGDNLDKTRLPSFYDPIFDYLKSCGIEEI